MSWMIIKGADREHYQSRVWAMYVATYQKMGLTLGSRHELMKYDTWGLFHIGNDILAFNVMTTTKFGLKSGLSGSDGSSAGKNAVIMSLATRAHTPGMYAEVSGKVEEIMLSHGAPVVCTKYVEHVLGKPIKPEHNHMHYTRSISGVGSKRKILLGLPNGIPTTNFHHPKCD